MAQCPCDGTLDQRVYSGIVDRLVHGFNHDPSLLLDPLLNKMEKVAREQRYEEAGWIRDRYNALAQALERRQKWKAIQETGVAEVVTAEGDRFVVDHGVLVASWKDQETMPLQAVPVVEIVAAEVAPNVEVAEEVDLIWRWLDKKAVQLATATGSLALPRLRVQRLKVGRAD